MSLVPVWDRRSLKTGSRVLMWIGLVGIIPLVLIGCSASGPEPINPTVSVLAEGGPLHGSNGMIIGPDGLIYVASVSSSVIAAINPDSGVVVEEYGPAEGVNGPDDLIFGEDGSMYWTDIASGEVGRRTPDGVTTIVASVGPGANPITFSDDGRLFVSQCFLGTHLFEIDPDGVGEPRLINDELGPGCGLNGMDWGPDGRLYGPRWFRGEVARVNVDTGAVETAASDFQIPASVKFDSQGRLHVLDAQAGEVVRVDLESGEKEVIGRPGLGLDNFAFTPDDRLFVSSFADGSIVEVTGPETNRVVVSGGIVTPGGLAFIPGADGIGRLFVADSGGLLEFNAESGEEVHAVNAMFSEVGQVMSAHADGNHLVLGSGRTVTIWDPDSDSLVARFEGFNEAIDALSYGGDIVVSEFGSGSVIRFSPDAPDDRTVVVSGLDEPAGLAVHNDDVYVADRTGSVFHILHDGNALGEPHPVVTGLAGPEGISISEDGALFVVEEEAGRVSQIDIENGTSTIVAEGLELLGLERKALEGITSVGYLSAVVVGDNALFVSAYPVNRVYRLDF